MQKSSFSKLLLGFFCALSLAMLFRLLIHSYLVFPYIFRQGDMEPNLKKGQRIYVWRIFDREDLKRGALVLLSYSGKNTKNEDEEYNFIRRIVALEGEEFSLRKRKLYINGKALEKMEKKALWEQKIQKHYKKIPIITSKTGNWDFFAPVRIKKGEFFVLADKRLEALDSRLLGSFSLGQIKGILKE